GVVGRRRRAGGRLRICLAAARGEAGVRACHLVWLADRPPPDEVGAVDGDDRLDPAAHVPLVVETRAGLGGFTMFSSLKATLLFAALWSAGLRPAGAQPVQVAQRSEERRVGKERRAGEGT